MNGRVKDFTKYNCYIYEYHETKNIQEIIVKEDDQKPSATIVDFISRIIIFDSCNLHSFNEEPTVTKSNLNDIFFLSFHFEVSDFVARGFSRLLILVFTSSNQHIINFLYYKKINDIFSICNNIQNICSNKFFIESNKYLIDNNMKGLKSTSHNDLLSFLRVCSLNVNASYFNSSEQSNLTDIETLINYETEIKTQLLDFFDKVDSDYQQYLSSNNQAERINFSNFNIQDDKGIRSSLLDLVYNINIGKIIVVEYADDLSGTLEFFKRYLKYFNPFKDNLLFSDNFYDKADIYIQRTNESTFRFKVLNGSSHLEQVPKDSFLMELERVVNGNEKLSFKLNYIIAELNRFKNRLIISIMSLLNQDIDLQSLSEWYFHHFIYKKFNSTSKEVILYWLKLYNQEKNNAKIDKIIEIIS